MFVLLFYYIDALAYISQRLFKQSSTKGRLFFFFVFFFLSLLLSVPILFWVLVPNHAKKRESIKEKYHSISCCLVVFVHLFVHVVHDRV